jgi:hypothetical protein
VLKEIMSYFCALTHPFFFILWCEVTPPTILLTVTGSFVLTGLVLQLPACVLSRYVKQEAISDLMRVGCIMQFAGGVTQLLLVIAFWETIGFYFFAVMLQHINSIPFYYTFRGHFKQVIKNVVANKTKEIQNWYNQNKL